MTNWKINDKIYSPKKYDNKFLDEQKKKPKLVKENSLTFNLSLILNLQSVNIFFKSTKRNILSGSARQTFKLVNLKICWVNFCFHNRTVTTQIWLWRLVDKFFDKYVKIWNKY